MTRKDIKSIFENATDEQITAILDLHHANIDSIKDENNELAKQLAKVNADLTAANEAREEIETELSNHQSAAAGNEAKTVKLNAYTALLKKCGVSEKYIARIVKLIDTNEFELDESGNIKDSDKVAESIKTEWSDYIAEMIGKGEDVPNPPTANAGKTAFECMSLREKMIFANTHPAEYAAYTANA